jgi:dTDP-4-dehydrorhamnose reductase
MRDRPMRVAVIGGNGQLGTDALESFAANGDDVFSLTHADIELSDPNSVSKSLKDLRPQLMVNTAAMHHVEKCESEPGHAFAVNALGARNLACVARDTGAVLIHVSTDYVFDGTKTSPYTEEDAPRPLNTYGNTKLAGEYFVRSIAEKHFVLRTSALYGKNPCRAKGGLNFVELMLKLAKDRRTVRVVDCEFVTPTRTTELARQMVALSGSDCYGVYHATAEGCCSWYECARQIFRLTNIQVTLEVARPDEFPAKVPRPKYSVLENKALKRCGLNVLRPWQEGLSEYLSSER